MCKFWKKQISVLGNEKAAKENTIEELNNTIKELQGIIEKSAKTIEEREEEIKS